MNASVRLVPVGIANYHTIQNMARFYVYDMSEYLGHQTGWEIPLNGLYECIDFKMYWDNPKTQFPFLIYCGDEIAGFVIIDKRGMNPDVDFNVAQFFIIRKFKRAGIGRRIAVDCFNQFIGKWNVMCLPENVGAYKFWSSVIREYTQGQFEEYNNCKVSHLDDIYNVFQFCSHYLKQLPEQDNARM